MNGRAIEEGQSVPVAGTAVSVHVDEGAEGLDADQTVVVID